MHTRARAGIDSEPHSGDTLAPAAHMDDSGFDRLPPEMVWTVVSWLKSTADLVRAGATCRRLAAVSAAIRRKRTAVRCKRGPHIDLTGCAHQLLTAIAMDDPSAMVDALDVGHVGLRDDLGLSDISTRVARAVAIGSSIGAVMSRVGRSFYYGTHNDTPLYIAITCGSARCAHALATMGASLSTSHAIDAVCVLIRDVAWRSITVWHRERDNTGNVPLAENTVMRRAGPVDPTKVLGPVFEKGVIAVATTSARLLLGQARGTLDILARQSLPDCRDDAFCARVLAGAPALISLLIERGCRPHSPKFQLRLDAATGLRSAAERHAQAGLWPGASQVARLDRWGTSERDLLAAIMEDTANALAALPPDAKEAYRSLAQYRMDQAILAVYDAAVPIH